jgi:RNA polymerase primary sigma factor
MMISDETDLGRRDVVPTSFFAVKPRGGLSSEQEQRLAMRIAQGDREARNALVSANLGLVARIARGFLDRGLPMDDLVGEGNLGLIRAAQTFDPRFGTRFSTYATYWIKESIRRALIDTAPTIRVPAHAVRLLGKYREAAAGFGRSQDREPTFDEVTGTMGLTVRQKHLVSKARRAVGLHVRSGPGRSRGLVHEWLADHGDPPDARLEAADERDQLLRRLARLSYRQRVILIWQYGLGGTEPLTLEEIGRRLGLSKEGVRRISSIAMRKLAEQPDRILEALA